MTVDPENISVGDEILWKEYGVVGEVIEPMRLNFSSDDVDMDKIPHEIRWEEMRKLPICEGNHTDFMYHDEREEWVCPECHL